jgi:DNA polymerase-1
MLLRIEREYQPNYACAVFDAPGPSFRDALYPAYKANRPPTPPELILQIQEAHRVVEAFGFPSFCIPGVEADDVIATLAKQASAEGLQVIIGSSDKDLMQIVDDRVRLLDPMRNRLMGVAEVIERFGVPPEKLGDLLALMGDTADNVPGISGIGPKSAADLISTWGSLSDILAHAKDIKGKKSEAILRGQDTLALSRTLVTLRENVPLDKELATLRRSSLDWARLEVLFRELEFGRLLQEAKSRSQPVETEPADLPANPDSKPAASDLPTVLSAGIVTTEAELAGLRRLVSESTELGVAYYLDPKEGTLLGIAFAFPSEESRYLPIVWRTLGSVTELNEKHCFDFLKFVFLEKSIPIHVHDAKPLVKALLDRDLSLPNLGIDTLLAALVLPTQTMVADQGNKNLELDGQVSMDRAGWLGSGRKAIQLSSLSNEIIASHLSAEARTILGQAKKITTDLELTEKWALYHDIERALVPVLARMERWGVRLDSNHLRNLTNDVAVQVQALEQEIHTVAGVKFNLGSPKQLAEILFGKLGLPVLKKTKTGPSTDGEVLESLASLHPLPAMLVEWRGLTKLRSTYLEALPALVNPRTHRLHTTFHQDGAATGRFSSTDPNLQNIPIRSELGRKIRQAFTADPGFSIVSADYSQIELRVLTHFCEDPAFLSAFRNGADIHRRTAAEVFEVAEADVTPEQRRIAKAINFGLVFGQTDFGLARVLKISRQEAKQYIERYFARYSKVEGFMNQAIETARRTSRVETLLGRVRPLPEIHSSRSQVRSYAERIARNTPIQGSAADILKLAMLKVARGLPRFPNARLLLTVHDELVFEVPNEEVKEFVPWVKTTMETACTLKVPLVVEVGVGSNWGNAH